MHGCKHLEEVTSFTVSAENHTGAELRAENVFYKSRRKISFLLSQFALRCVFDPRQRKWNCMPVNKYGFIWLLSLKFVLKWSFFYMFAEEIPYVKVIG